jgi:glycosyltransferase involved in cell wall biosynthesis
LFVDVPPVFTSELRRHVKNGAYGDCGKLVVSRVREKAQYLFHSRQALTVPLVKGRRWGRILASQNFNEAKYDIIFLTVGFGDEYLLETAKILSDKLKIPMVVDFRDLWSEHHNQDRFTDEERRLIRGYESRLLANAVLVSVPQQEMVKRLNNWVKKDVCLFSHSAYVAPEWRDGQVVSDEFRMLYAGKLYGDGPGINMLLQLLSRLVAKHPNKKISCHFYIDTPEKLTTLVQQQGLGDHVVVNGWIAPDALWRELRSAHLLVVTDSGVAEDFPIVPTKTFQYAHTGRQILSLEKHQNPAMEAFLKQYEAGKTFSGIDDACEWVAELMRNEHLYTVMPALRQVPLRNDAALNLAADITRVLRKGHLNG